MQKDKNKVLISKKKQQRPLFIIHLVVYSTIQMKQFSNSTLNLINSKLSKAKELLNLSEDEFQGVKNSIDDMISNS